MLIGYPTSIQILNRFISLSNPMIETVFWLCRVVWIHFQSPPVWSSVFLNSSSPSLIFHPFNSQRLVWIFQVLCIHLKRFRHEMYHSSKISNYVSFPVNDLDLKSFLDQGECTVFITSTAQPLFDFWIAKPSELIWLNEIQFWSALSHFLRIVFRFLPFSFWSAQFSTGLFSPDSSYFLIYCCCILICTWLYPDAFKPCITFDECKPFGLILASINKFT